MDLIRNYFIFAMIGLVILGCSDENDDQSVDDSGLDTQTEQDAAVSKDSSTPAMDAASDGTTGTDDTDASQPAFILPTIDEEGPFTAVTETGTGPDGDCTLFRPEPLASDDILNPIVVWGNGGGTTPDLYAHLPYLATHGFVVIAPNSTMVDGELLRAALDWLIEQNEDPSSVFYQKLNTDKLGAIGYSNGSLAIYRMLDSPDPPDLDTTIHVSGGIWVSGGIEGLSRDAVLKEPGPTAYFCDASPVNAENPLSGGTKDNCDGDYELVEVPCFYGSLLEGAVHISIPFQPFIGRIAKASVAWFRWFLMDDDSQQSVFLGDDCELCNDPAWSVQRKNWEDWQ
jgi:hypothetical protein